MTLVVRKCLRHQFGEHVVIMRHEFTVGRGCVTARRTRRLGQEPNPSDHQRQRVQIRLAAQ